MFSTLLPSLDRRSSSPTASSPFIGGAKHLPQVWGRTLCKYEAGVQMLLLLHDCFHLFRLDCQCLMVWTGKDLIRFRPGGECFDWSGLAVFFHLASTSKAIVILKMCLNYDLPHFAKKIQQVVYLGEWWLQPAQRFIDQVQFVFSFHEAIFHQKSSSSPSQLSQVSWRDFHCFSAIIRNKGDRGFLKHTWL